MWGTILWGFGLLLGRMAEQSELLVPIDAQIIEFREPARRVAVPKQPAPKPMPRSTSPQLPAPVSQPVTQSSSQTQPIVETPALSTPVVSLPETNLPAGNKKTADTVQPLFESGTKTSSKVSQGPITVTPPQFGAAYLNNPKPGYPASAKRMGMEGTVMLKVLVSREGGALKIEIARSSGYDILDKAASEAVRGWRFVPARQGDTPIEEWVQVPVAFRLKK
jgi:protein TonB